MNSENLHKEEIEKIYDILDKGNSLIKENKEVADREYEKANKYLSDCIKKNLIKDKGKILYLQGLIFYKLRNYKKGLNYLQKAGKSLKDEELKKKNLLGIAHSYSALKRYNEAIEIFKELLRQRKNDADKKDLYKFIELCYKGLTIKAVKRRNYLKGLNYIDQALNYYKKYLNSEFKNDQKKEKAEKYILDLYYSKGTIYYSLKKYNEAINEFNKVIKDSEDKELLSLCYSYLADAYYAKKEIQRGHECIYKFFGLKEFHPEPDRVYLQLAYIKYEQGELDEVIKLLSELIDKYPKTRYYDEARTVLEDAKKEMRKKK